MSDFLLARHPLDPRRQVIDTESKLPPFSTVTMADLNLNAPVAGQKCPHSSITRTASNGNKPAAGTPGLADQEQVNKKRKRRDSLHELREPSFEEFMKKLARASQRQLEGVADVNGAGAGEEGEGLEQTHAVEYLDAEAEKSDLGEDSELSESEQTATEDNPPLPKFGNGKKVFVQLMGQKMEREAFVVEGSEWDREAGEHVYRLKNDDFLGKYHHLSVSEDDLLKPMFEVGQPVGADLHSDEEYFDGTVQEIQYDGHEVIYLTDLYRVPLEESQLKGR